MTDESVRAFVALELPEWVGEAVADLQARLRPRLGSVRLVRPEGAHLTLRFLGQTSPAQEEALRGPLARAAGACPPCEARVAGLGTFPERGSPRVLWLGLELADAVLALQEACERAAVAAGFAREDRAFKPHLTLGRWRERAPPAGSAPGRPRPRARGDTRPLPQRAARRRLALHAARAVPAGRGDRLTASESP